jgi:hypothetical protein
MRLATRGLCGAGLLLLAAATVVAQEGLKPQLTVTMQTSKIAIPGLDKLPPEALKALGGLSTGQRTLSVSLISPGAPPASPTADLDIPAGLKLGSTLNLEIPKGNGQPGPGGVPPGSAIESFEFTRYWGCSATVKPGQPKIVKGSEITAASQARAIEEARKAGLKGPETTFAMWPNSKVRRPEQLKIDPAATAPGRYELKTNYTGGVSFDLPANVNFLEAIQATVDGKDLGKPVQLSWKPVPNALGYLAMAFGIKGKNSQVMWVSSEADGGFDHAFNTSGEIEALVKEGVYMPTTKTDCTIPAGIFQGCQGVSVQIVAYGPSFIQSASRPAVRVLTESRSIHTLGGLPDGQ